jgi:hypothetical protein
LPISRGVRNSSICVLFAFLPHERNDFVLKDLLVLPAAVTNIFMVPAFQLLHL